MYDLLEKAGYRFDIYTYEEYSPADIWNKASNYSSGKVKIDDIGNFIKLLSNLIIYKNFPDLLKQYVWISGTEFNSLKEVESEEILFDNNNIIFYNTMQNSSFTTQNDNKCFKFIHLSGVHYPYYINQNVEEVPDSETSDVQCARGALKIVQDYMEKMQEKNVYDNSTIIIMADHGYYWDGVLTNPVLLVKPKKSIGRLELSNAPVSHHDFQPSILSFAGLNDNGKWGESYYDISEQENRERLFYQYYLMEGDVNGNYRLIEYSIDSSSNARESFSLTDTEYLATGEIVSHKDNCAYCQSGEKPPIETDENRPLMIVHSQLKQ